ncbi:MAG TPA: tripartite tricarboxylate transporter substrate binding protein [Alphaproteobacteria bacterium]|nr:tripartite tricarboxylate transporter substrate binding protein [Alphaproteobacteria bacterium]
MRHRLVAALVAVIVFAAGAAGAEDYPARPIRVVVNFAAGGTTDILARWIARGFSENTGHTIVVENRGGAGGNVGAEAVARSAPDGYTLVMVSSGTIVINPWLYTKMSYDPLTELVGVFNVGNAPQFLMMSATVPAKTLQEFIALAKKDPGKFNYASPGAGTTPHLAMILFERVAGVKLVHIPYRGVGATVPDLVSGRVQLLSTSIPPVAAQVAAGEVIPLCLGAPKRLPAAPAIPTAAEAGLPGYEMTTWFGFLAPTGTDPARIAYLNAEFQKVLDRPETQKRLETLGVIPNGGSPAQFQAMIKEDAKYWKPIVEASGVKEE